MAQQLHFSRLLLCRLDCHADCRFRPQGDASARAQPAECQGWLALGRVEEEREEGWIAVLPNAPHPHPLHIQLIGVTGGIGCGKSTVVKRLEEVRRGKGGEVDRQRQASDQRSLCYFSFSPSRQLGNPVVDCDKLGHLAYEPGSAGHAQVRSR